MRRALCTSLAMMALLTPRPLAAQSENGGLAQLVPNLFLKGITLPGAENPGAPHGGHFTLGNPTAGTPPSQTGSQADPSTIRAIEAFGDRLTAQFASVPLGSSTGGFTYSFNEQSGLYTRNTDSFGPAFTERAATIGRKKLSFGTNYQRTTFDTFGGQNLDDGSIIFYLPHTDCCTAGTVPSPLTPGFESDLLEASLQLKASTDTFAFFANYGVTDRFDVGVAVPIVHVSLDANIHARIIRLSTSASNVHTFSTTGADDIDQDFPEEGSASGLGDIVLRTKYNFLNTSNAGLSVGIDLRLPTGDEDDLLGLGTTQGKFLFIVSSNHQRFATHMNFGFTVSGEGSPQTFTQYTPLGVSDELNYAGGVEFIAHPKVTLLGDFIGRTLFDAGNIGLQTSTFNFIRQGDTTNTLRTSSTNPLTNGPYEQLALAPGDLSTLLGAVGVKFNPATNLLVNANVLFPLSDSGLQDHMTFAFGFEYAF